MRKEPQRRPGGRRKIIRLRTRRPGTLLKVCTAIGWCLVAIGVSVFVNEIGRWKEGELAGASVLVFWGTVIGVFGARSQRHGASHLRIDLGHGTATFVYERVDRAIVPLHQLGTLAITTETLGARDWHDLRASGLPDVSLYGSANLLDVQQRRAYLELLVGQHAIERLLAHDAPGDGAFRDDPDLAFRAQQLVPDRARLLQVLDALEQGSRDPGLRAQIIALREQLSR